MPVPISVRFLEPEQVGAGSQSRQAEQAHAPEPTLEQAHAPEQAHAREAERCALAEQVEWHALWGVGVDEELVYIREWEEKWVEQRVERGRTSRVERVRTRRSVGVARGAAGGPVGGVARGAASGPVGKQWVGAEGTQWSSGWTSGEAGWKQWSRGEAVEQGRVEQRVDQWVGRGRAGNGDVVWRAGRKHTGTKKVAKQRVATVRSRGRGPREERAPDGWGRAAQRPEADGWGGTDGWGHATDGWGPWTDGWGHATDGWGPGTDGSGPADGWVWREGWYPATDAWGADGTPATDVVFFCCAMMFCCAMILLVASRTSLP